MSERGTHRGTEAEEAEWIRRIAAKDSTALSELYDRFADILYSVALQLLQDRGQTEDVLQEVFLQIWDRAVTFDPAQGKPITWAVVMTRNKCIDFLRRQKRQGRGLDEYRESVPDTSHISTPTGSDTLALSEQVDAARRALATLNEDQRIAIQLAFIDGLSQTEIAERLNEPLGTIKARIRRGMIQLRALIQVSMDGQSTTEGTEG